MAIEYWAGGLAALLLFFYLLYVLFRPEKF
jgi:K+-transporting ATPase KdpF subunit